MPTPDIDIGELRRLEQAATADPSLGNLFTMTNADWDYWTALRNAAPALLAKAEAADGAYHERDMLVCALSKCFPSYLARHPAEDKTWEDDWRWIVYIELPTGQASWHIHASEHEMFNHLEVRENNWDGHNTERKYQRLAALQSMPLLAKWEECDELKYDNANLRTSNELLTDLEIDLRAELAALKSRLALAEAVVSAARGVFVTSEGFGHGVGALRRALSTYEGKSE